MNVIKRDGSKEELDLKKVYSAIEKAFNACCPDENVQVITSMIQDMHLWDDITVEEIQDIVVETLRDYGFDEVADKYNEYRGYKAALRHKVQERINFINRFKETETTADTTIDDNSNVANHNIAVLNAEIHKPDNREVNLRMLRDRVKELYPDFNYKQMDKDFNSIMYLHDSSSQVGMPYCVAISIYPFLTNGIEGLGGLSSSPKNLDSFCGMFINLVFAVAAQFKGAVAVPGWILAMDWYARKEFGENYHLKKDVIWTNEHCTRTRTIENQIDQYFQQICYGLMQPAQARGAQACFWNTSIFDKGFFEGMYSDFYYPDGTKPNWESFNYLQKHFVDWLNNERLRCILTFPVVTFAMIYKDGKYQDQNMHNFNCEMYAKGSSHFTYVSDTADSLSSCCRLQNKLADNTFSFTNGQIGEMTGSLNVITLNISRIVQDWHREYINSSEFNAYTESLAGSTDRTTVWTSVRDYIPSTRSFTKYLNDILERVYKYQTAYRSILKDLQNGGLLTVYNAGFIDMKRQYLTTGVNGLNQAAEFLGLECTNNNDYATFVHLILGTIKEFNTSHRTNDIRLNTEQTP